MKPRGRQMMAWLLTAAVTLSGNSFTVLADEMDVQVQQETSENEEVIFAAEEAGTVQDEAVDTEELPYHGKWDTDQMIRMAAEKMSLLQ